MGEVLSDDGTDGAGQAQEGEHLVVCDVVQGRRGVAAQKHPGPAAKELARQREDAQDDVHAAVVHENGGAPVRPELHSIKPFIQAVNQPGPR